MCQCPGLVQPLRSWLLPVWPGRASGCQLSGKQGSCRVPRLRRQKRELLLVFYSCTTHFGLIRDKPTGLMAIWWPSECGETSTLCRSRCEQAFTGRVLEV